MMSLRRGAFALVSLTFFANEPTAALDARVIFEASEHALAPAMRTPAITLTMQGVYIARDQASRPEIPAAEVPDRQSVVLVRDGRYRLESDTVFPGTIRFHYLTVGSPTAWASVDLIRWRNFFRCTVPHPLARQSRHALFPSSAVDAGTSTFGSILGALPQGIVAVA
jgi:hypothetical protein